MKRRLFLLLLVCGALLAGLWWQGRQLQTVQRSRMVMGTLVEISVTGRSGLALHELLEEAFGEMERIEGLMSSHLAGSEVARLGAVKELRVSAETREVLEIGLEVARRSHGAFDLTLGKLVRLWDTAGTNPRVPTAEQIAAALRGSGPQALRLKGSRVIKQSLNLQPELGGIAKGYAVDAAARILRRAPIVAAAVNAGGDMTLIGSPPQRDWRIGIQHPRRSRELLATLIVDSGAVVTSGDYERFFEYEGQRYHHLLDPRSGYPARGCQSVTVLGSDATYADALATAAFVLGPEQGLELLEEWPGFEGLLVAADGEIFITSGMQGRIEWP